jgi:Hint domain
VIHGLRKDGERVILSAAHRLPLTAPRSVSGALDGLQHLPQVPARRRVPAGCLINGATISLCEARELDKLEYFNIKLEGHDVIYAEGAAVETIANVDESAVNFAEYFRKYGVPQTDETRCPHLLPTAADAASLRHAFAAPSRLGSIAASRST